MPRFDKPFYLMFNVAVGGNAGSNARGRGDGPRQIFVRVRRHAWHEKAESLNTRASVGFRAARAVEHSFYELRVKINATFMAESLWRKRVE